jgi:glutaminyl-peptide cyclotransferase
MRLAATVRTLLAGLCTLLPLSFPASAQADSAPAQAAVEFLEPVVLASHPHDEAAFTQGLLLLDGRLFESTGLYGASSLREIDLPTGEVLRQVDLAERYFGEGLARVDDRLIQLTWRNGVAFVWGLEDFRFRGVHQYQGEGWGLCSDGERLVMSDGSATLTFRDPATFRVQGTLEVTLNGAPLQNINELECAPDGLYANVWLTDLIVRIDPLTGVVTAVIDAAGLLSAEQRAALSPGAVLNGIAYDAEADAFLVTGKLWPVIFLVRFE